MTRTLDADSRPGALNDTGLILLAVGDVAVEREQPHAMFAGVAQTLRQGDFVFGQLETPMSARGAPAPHPTLAVRSNPDGYVAIKDAGFNVMSFAGNHCLDWGAE